MPLDVKDAGRLWDMLDAARAAVEFVEGLSVDQYTSDRRTRNAVERNLEIIGEAARNVTEDARTQLPAIPWRSVVGLRNIIAHEYGEILHEKVWAICNRRLPDLIAQLERAGVDDPPQENEKA